MKVKLKAGADGRLPPLLVRLSKGGEYENTSGLVMGRTYLVYACFWRDGYIHFLIANSDYANTKRPWFYPCSVFEVVDGTLSRYWLYRQGEAADPDVGVISEFAYKEWFEDGYWDRLWDYDRATLDQFAAIKQKMDAEFEHVDEVDPPPSTMSLNVPLSLSAEQIIERRAKPFRMIVKDCFRIHGRGPVVLGHIEYGTVHLNQTLACTGVNGNFNVRVVKIEKFKEYDLRSASVPEEIGLELEAASADQFVRGDVLSAL